MANYVDLLTYVWGTIYESNLCISEQEARCLVRERLALIEPMPNRAASDWVHRLKNISS